MPMRLSELHPAAVHYPIALLPVAIASDAAGLITKSRSLHAVGRVGIVLAAASAAVAGILGFIAQEEVELTDESRPTLQTHRTLNIVALAGVTALAIVRATQKRPGLGYLLGGAAAIATVGVSAYLGGKLVYDHGLGVARVGGSADTDPDLLEGRAPGRAVRDLAQGVAHTAQDLARGDVLPLVQRR